MPELLLAAGEQMMVTLTSSQKIERPNIAAATALEISGQTLRPVRTLSCDSWACRREWSSLR
jgi:hypothetical protein